MALIRNFTRKERDRISLHDRDGRHLLQIDTYGRDTREMPGKQSQTIQLDRDGALSLFTILKREFNLN